ncbi:MAG: hypothetical protein KY458_13615 [Actinobacteria bacterium]|nr:hypothetical protein [Actinomycetota bacterium]
MAAAPGQSTPPTTLESPLNDVGVRVSVSRDRAATVVVLDGVVGPNDCDLVGQRIPPPGDATGITIVDLNNVTLLDRYAFHRLLKKLSPPGAKVKLVCRRSTARQLLRAWQLHERFDIFATTEMALHRSEVRTS